MSSLRNAIKRITHKERGQPRERAHLGMLEKKKDYRRRAQNYHQKRDQLVKLRRRAAMRNPDEFYTGMHNAEVVEGKHVQTEEARMKELEGEIGEDAVKMMKEQDLSYVRWLQQKDGKRMEKLQSSLHFMEANDSDDEDDDEEEEDGLRKKCKKKKAKHTIFVDSEEQAENFDAAEHFGTLPELVGRKFNRPRVETLLEEAKQKRGLKSRTKPKHDDDDDYYSHSDSDSDSDGDSDGEKATAKLTNPPSRASQEESAARLKRVATARENAYATLEALQKRKASMALAESHLVTERLIQGKNGRKRKIKAAQDGKPAVYKWSRQRLG